MTKILNEMFQYFEHINLMGFEDPVYNSASIYRMKDEKLFLVTLKCSLGDNVVYTNAELFSEMTVAENWAVKFIVDYVPGVDDWE